MTFDQLARNTPMSVRKRATPVNVTPLGVQSVDPLGQVDLFTTTSGKGNYLSWVYVDPKGQCKVSCACGMFTYVLEAALASKGASVILYSNGASPQKTNPLRRAYLCKHLYKVWLGRMKYKIGYHEEEEPEEEVTPPPKPMPQPSPKPIPRPQSKPSVPQKPGGAPSA
jgi:hypothetical protein